MYEDNKIDNATQFSDLCAILTFRKRYRLNLDKIRLFCVNLSRF